MVWCIWLDRSWRPSRIHLLLDQRYLPCQIPQRMVHECCLFSDVLHAFVFFILFLILYPFQMTAECTPPEAFSIVGDHAIFASGSPFCDVNLGTPSIIALIDLTNHQYRWLSTRLLPSNWKLLGHLFFFQPTYMLALIGW